MAKATKALIPIFLCLLLLAMGCAKKPPTITSISPSSGPSGGDTKITIKGENFKEGAAVTIAGRPVKNMSINPEGTTVTAVTPGGAPGSQKVVATNVKAKEPSIAASFTYEGLKILSTVPTDGAQLPWQESGIQASATFSQDIQSGSASISIGGVAGEASFDASARTVAFTASGPLRTLETFTVTVSGAKDMAGNVMSDYSFGFGIEDVEKVDWYTVKEDEAGDSLSEIAARPEVYEDESKWKLILEANQDQEWVSEDGEYGSDNIIDRKNLIPGMVLRIPR